MTAKEHGGVQSIARVFVIAEEIARNRDGIGLAELSKRVGLHNSTTSLVKTMCSWLRKPAGGFAQIPHRPAHVHARGRCLDEIELVSVATPILEQLTRKTGEYSHFAIARESKSWW